MGNKIVFALIGMIIGGVVSGIFVGVNCARTYKKRIDELTEKNQKLVDRNREERQNDIQKRERRTRKAEAKIDASLNEQLVQAMKEKHRTKEIAREHGYLTGEENADYDLADAVEFDDSFDEEESVVIKKPAETKMPVFSIMSQEDYETDFEFRDSESLTYYQVDHVLADAFDDLILDDENLVGKDALEKAKETNDDYVYVLDEAWDKMYEIEINHEESYYRDIVRGGVM